MAQTHMRGREEKTASHLAGGLTWQSSGSGNTHTLPSLALYRCSHCGLSMSTLSVRGLRCMASLRSGAASFARGHSSALSCVARRTPAAVRDFRASLVVEMGRRSAKIANSKARPLLVRFAIASQPPCLQGKADMARAKLYGRVGKQIVAACVPRSASLP